MTTRESNADKDGRVPGGGAGNNDAKKATGGGGAVHAFRWLMRQIRVSTLIFLAIVVVANAVINIMFAYFGVFEAGETWAYSEILSNTTAIYMLVLGIILPLYLEMLVAQGATRHQFAAALLGASALTACVLALFSVVVALVIADVTVTSVLRWALGNWFFFLVGWLVVIGYQYRHVITAFASTLMGICLLSLWPFWSSYVTNTDLSKTAITLFGPMPTFLSTVVCFVASLALAFIIHALTRRIPIKV